MRPSAVTQAKNAQSVSFVCAIMLLNMLVLRRRAQSRLEQQQAFLFFVFTFLYVLPMSSDVATKV